MRETRRGLKSSEVAVRERLLACATQLFTRKGYTGTTVREIVAAAGVTKPVLYYYFQNKEGIYLELIRGAFAKLDAILESSRSERGNAIEKLLRLCNQVLSLFEEKIEVAKLMYSISYGPPQGAPFFDFDSHHVKFHEAVRRLIREGMRQGEFKKGNVEDIMWSIMGAVNVAMEVQLCHPELRMDRKRLARILHLIFKGIGIDSRGRKRGHA